MANEVNESEEEDPTTPSGAQQHKRACVDKWSFPDELRSAVGWALIRVARALNRMVPPLLIFRPTYVRNCTTFSAKQRTAVTVCCVSV